MQMLIDFLPVILFFAAYKISGDLLTATGVLMVASVAQVGWMWWRHRKVQPMHLVSLGLVILLGGATLLFHDKSFIQWKPTVVNWLFGAAFLLAPLFGGRTLVERLMGASLTLPKAVWQRLNIAWVIFFALMGGLNLWVFEHFSEEAWVNFKLFGMLGLTLVFVILQGLYLSKHLRHEPSDS
ncbi:septation protein A [Terasakiispira papahanaumokuakeensis]|uniref:Inner membrane-spanning protein YciB n=1 Tax=Terasakiispira papahanaumokuakeensis TaxID=197479 RepID=A0A1E2VAT0_9GAMM|nr:septation protein A [Terasakiispira papahanaumokuakeensis]ODC04120.1 septation protein A [Terasakiispira papahanaumokuakeensis]